MVIAKKRWTRSRGADDLWERLSSCSRLAFMLKQVALCPLQAADPSSDHLFTSFVQASSKFWGRSTKSLCLLQALLVYCNIFCPFVNTKTPHTVCTCAGCSEVFPLSRWMHLLFPNTRWLSVLCMLCISTSASSPRCFHWPWKCKDEPKIFVNNALRHLGYGNTQLHRQST